jgi:hypothetical protein
MENKLLIKKLAECAAASSYCATACINEKDVSMLRRCISINLDCADICTLVAGMLARGSQHGIHLLTECREICMACAAECELHGNMDHCEKAASVCRDCGELCAEEMVH